MNFQITQIVPARPPFSLTCFGKTKSEAQKNFKAEYRRRMKYDKENHRNRDNTKASQLIAKPQIRRPNFRPMGISRSLKRGYVLIGQAFLEDLDRKRRVLKWGFAKFAEKSGISETTIQSIFRGAKSTKLEHLEALRIAVDKAWASPEIAVPDNMEELEVLPLSTIPITPEHIAEFKSQLKKLDYSIYYVAKTTGIPWPRANGILTGKTKRCNPERLKKLQDCLQITGVTKKGENQNDLYNRVKTK